MMTIPSRTSSMNPPRPDDPNPQSSSGGQGRIVIVASGKGGVGKTWFSITLAQSLAQSGQKVLLFDGDLGLANVDIQLGLMPDRDLSHFAEGRYRLKDIIFPYPIGSFHIIPGRSGCGDLAALSPVRMGVLREELKGLTALYDVILVDLGAGVDGVVQGLLPIADDCCVITTDEPTSMTDAYAFIKVMRQKNHGTPIHLVVNQADHGRAGQQTYETLRKTCASFLAFSPALLGVVRRDPHVKDSIKCQAPLMARHPTSSAAVDVGALTKVLLGVWRG